MYEYSILSTALMRMSSALMRHNKSSTSNPELRGGISKPKQPFLLRSASNPGIIIPGTDQV